MICLFSGLKGRRGKISLFHIPANFLGIMSYPANKQVIIHWNTQFSGNAVCLQPCWEMRQESTLLQLCSSLCLTVWVWVSHTLALCFSPLFTRECSFMLAFDQSRNSWLRQPCQQKPSVWVQVHLCWLEAVRRWVILARAALLVNCFPRSSVSMLHRTHTPVLCPQVAPASASLKWSEQLQWKICW